MRSRSDDELYAVENRYLGPPGRTMPWQARYRAYAVWVGWFFVLVILRQQLGIFSGAIGWGLVALLAVFATRTTMRFVGPERPTFAVLGLFVGELSAPRDVANTDVAVIDPRHVRVTSERPTGRPA